MIIIQKDIILKYLPLLKPIHIKKYADSISFPISDQECNILYQFIKENSIEILESENSLLKLKPLVREDLYLKIVELYHENKTKYLS